MTRTYLLLAATLAFAPRLALADDKLTVTTAVIPFAGKTTEDQCLAQAKRALAASSFTNIHPMTHEIVGELPGYVAAFDCLQPQGANLAHLSIAAQGKSSDEIAKIATALVKAVLQPK
jgi:hypothetical protein